MNTNMRDSIVTRRQFFRQAGAASLVTLALPMKLNAEKTSTRKIERIEIYPMRYPMTGYFKFFAGPRGAQGRAAVLVKMTADDGTVGWGQSVPVARWSYETLETSTILLREYYAPALLGHDPLDIEGAHRIMDEAVAPAFSTGMPITRAGIDLALHDLAGKLTGQSLAQMWKRPQRKRLTLSWTVNARTVEEADQVMEEGWKRGYRNFNIKVAPDVDFDVQLAKRVRRRAPEGFLWADANGGYDLATALKAVPKLAEAGVDVLEAPVRPNQISTYQALTSQGALPILMDEGIVSPVELAEFIKLKMMNGVAMKPARCGGLLSNKRQIEIVQEAGLMWLGSGLTDPDISLAATVGLYAAFGLEKPAALNGPQFLTADVLKRPLQVENGTIAVPDGPGLGIEVDEAKVQDLARRIP
jgi:L-alanine-DL-glutamate epimerase-like enolase superfamily enzyme